MKKGEFGEITQNNNIFVVQIDERTDHCSMKLKYKGPTHFQKFIE